MTDSTRITDAMLRAAIEAMKPDRIQGFLYGRNTPEPVYVIRDVSKPYTEQQIFRCPVAEMDESEWAERCEMERLRIGFAAAINCRCDGEEARKSEGQ